MKKILLVVVSILLAISSFSSSPPPPPIEHLISDGSFTNNCTKQNFLYDSGGAGAIYLANEDYTITIIPSIATDKIQLVFSAFQGESGYDNLKIYDGATVAATLLGTWETTNPGTITSSAPGGELTLVWHTDGSGEYDGFEAEVFCYTPVNMTVTACTSTQTNTAIVDRGSVNQEIIALEILTSGTLNPISTAEFVVKTMGTDNVADIANAKIWYTGTNNTFATTSQFGSTSIANPPISATSMTFTGNQVLEEGTNYFWLTYDVTASATITNVVDASFETAIVNSLTETPTVSLPTGNREIRGTPCDNVISLTEDVVETYNCPTGNGDWANPDGCYASPGQEQVYSFIAPITADYELIVSSASDYMDYGWQEGACAETGWTCITDVNTPTTTGNFSWIAGTTYYIVLDNEGTTVNSQDFKIKRKPSCFDGIQNQNEIGIDCGGVCPDCTPDIPCEALEITVGCIGSKIRSDNTGATDSGIPAPSCGNYTGGDAWFSFTIPASGNVQVSTYPLGLEDMSMAIYSSSSNCSGTLTEIACDANSGFSNMSELRLNGLTGGETLFVRVWDEHNDEVGTFEIDAVDLDNNYCISGNSTDEGGNGCATLTTAIANQSGAIWDANDKFDFTSDWSYDFTINLGNLDAGGDGIAFVIHNDPNALQTTGSTGFEIGAGGIDNSLIIEIDTYINTIDRNDGITGLTCANDGYDHLDIWTNGIFGDGSDDGWCGDTHNRIVPNAVGLTSGGADYNIENGDDHILRIEYNVAGQKLTATILNPISSEIYGTIAYSPLDPLVLFGTNVPYFGFTASTGGVDNLQTACLAEELSEPLPVVLLDFTANCNKDNIEIEWTTVSEIDNDYFVIEKSLNAINFHEVAQIEGVGNSNSKQNYKWTDLELSNKTNYYRLKQVDFDGTIIYHKIISTECQSQSSNPELTVKLYPNPAEKQLNIILNNTDCNNCKVDFINTTGQVVLSADLSTETNIDISNLPKGIYLVVVKAEDEVFKEKVIVK